MKSTSYETDGATVVALEGDVDLDSSPQARRALLKAVKAKHKLVVDLSGVGHMDSSGVASLVEALQTARREGGSMVLAAPSDSSRRVLQLARLDRVFDIRANVDEALA